MNSSDKFGVSTRATRYSINLIKENFNRSKRQSPAKEKVISPTDSLKVVLAKADDHIHKRKTVNL